MKAILFLPFVLAILLDTCTSREEQVPVNLVAKNEKDSDVSVDFAKQIQPILQRRCSPCHFEGGKMYQKMPFDKGATIVLHKEGLLKRIKDPKENDLVKSYIESASRE